MEETLKAALDERRRQLEQIQHTVSSLERFPENDSYPLGTVIRYRMNERMNWASFTKITHVLWTGSIGGNLRYGEMLRRIANHGCVEVSTGWEPMRADISPEPPVQVTESKGTIRVIFEDEDDNYVWELRPGQKGPSMVRILGEEE